MKPWEQQSTQVARTQPLVVKPAMIRLPLAVSVEARLLPKKALAYYLEMTSSLSAGTSPSGHAPIG